MFSFTQKPKTSVKAANEDIAVNLSFNRVIQAYGVLDDETISLEERVVKACNIFLVNRKLHSPLTCSVVLEDIFDYLNQTPYGNYEDDDEVSGNTEEEQEEQEEELKLRDYDFEQDAGAIYASFFNYYHIDLNEYVDVMSWDRFKALFDNLGPNTPIREIQKIRNDDLSNYNSEEDSARKAAVTTMKEYYRLDKNAEIEDKLNQQKMKSMFGQMFKDAD